MNNLNVKINSRDITKEQLEDLYFNKSMTLDSIGKHFGYIDKEKDLAKDEFLKLKGYLVLRILEHEYKNNPKETLQQCLTFLNQ